MPSLLDSALVIRAIGFSSTDDIECPRPRSGEQGAPLFGEGSITLRQLMIYVSAPCLLITVVSCWFLSWRHLHRYTTPQEQRQILRIINLPVAYCLFNFLAVTFVADYNLIEPIGGVYEAFVVAALFFLVLEWVAPDGTDRERYFDKLELRSRKGEVQPGGSLKWFQRTWSSVLQYPLLKSVLILIQIITQYFNDYCEGSFSPKHAHLWLQLADLLFVGGALAAAIKFFLRLKRECAAVHRPQAKVWSFIGIIIFQVLQGLIFHLLNGKLFNPSKTATYNDINFGIASFMTCIETVIFSLIFQWSYSSSEYKDGQKLDRLGLGPAQRTTTIKAIFDALNPSDIVAGTFLAFQLLFMRVQSRYGGSGPPQRGMEDQMHLEPLTDRRNVRGYDYDMPRDTENETQYTAGYSPPPMPPQARDPSPGGNFGRAQRYSAGGMRPELDARRYSRAESPESQPFMQARPMV